MLNLFLEPFTDPASRTYLPALGVAVAVAVFLTWARRGSLYGLLQPFRTHSTVLDLQLLFARQLLRATGLLPVLAGSFSLAVFVVGGLDSLYVPRLEGVFVPVARVVYTVVLFVVWDGSRFFVHGLMHRVPFLWSFHQVHHSAESLTPLTFHRVHPVESALYQLRGVLVTGTLAGVFFWLFRGAVEPLTLLGVHSIGWVMNVISGNLRHSEVWWSFGRLERVFLSPAQHQLHHGKGTDHLNLGTWLSLWDQLAGSFAMATTPPEAYGLERPNHEHDLLSAWWGPFRALF